jgi:hypothetical protein
MPVHTDKKGTERGPVRLRAGVVMAIALSLSLGASACVVHTYDEEEVVYGYPAVRVVSAPPDLYLYPRTEYRGGYAYLVGDVWYYESPRGWVAFRSAPRELEARRVYTVRGRGRRPPPRVYEEKRVYEERRVPAVTRPAPREERRRVYRPD